MDRFIPLSVPNFEGNEKTYVNDALDQGWVSTGGAYITKLERAMADFLGVEIPEKKPEPEATDSVVAVTQTGGEGMGGVVARGYCPNCHCPSNIPYVVEGRLFYRPNRVLASPTGGVRCTQCGEILEMRCPVCGAPLNDGACCAVCGGAYVTPVLPEGVDPSAYARARRDEMLQLKALMQA